METEEENRSASGAGYYVFAFLFRVLVAAGRPRCRLVLRDRAVGGRTIIEGAALMRGEAALARGKRTDRPVKNLLTQWEMRRKTVVENFF